MRTSTLIRTLKAVLRVSGIERFHLFVYNTRVHVHVD